MKIYVTSRGRPFAERQITMHALHRAELGPRLVLTAADPELASYQAMCDRLGWTFEVVEAQYLAHKRDFLLQRSRKTGEKTVMLDDDVIFYRRNANMGTTNALLPTDLAGRKNAWPHWEHELCTLFSQIEEDLEVYSVVGVHDRFMIQATTYPAKVRCRQLYLYAWNPRGLDSLIKFRGRCMSDDDFIMQCLLAGHENMVKTNYCVQQIKPQATGGCNTYRTDTFLKEATADFEERWDKYLSPPDKKWPHRRKIRWYDLAVAGGLEDPA